MNFNELILWALQNKIEVKFCTERTIVDVGFNRAEYMYCATFSSEVLGEERHMHIRERAFEKLMIHCEFELERLYARLTMIKPKRYEP